MNDANRNDFRSEISVERPHGNEVRSVVKPFVGDDAEFHCDFLVPEPANPEMTIRLEKNNGVDTKEIQKAVKEAFGNQYPEIDFRVLAL